MSEKLLTPIEIGLTAAIVAIEGNEPLVLIAQGSDGDKPAGLPFGPFDAVAHRTFEIGLRAWVEEQTGLRLGYVEQLYTFGDRGRHTKAGRHRRAHGLDRLSRVDARRRQCLLRARRHLRTLVSLLPVGGLAGTPGRYHRRSIFPALKHWAAQAETAGSTRALSRKDRVRLYFGTEGGHWDEERVLDRYELLYEAGSIEEARRDGRPAALARERCRSLAMPMRFDHRRILATAIARLRAKLKYRPVVFELLPSEFTLTELQRTVEAISGRHLHKQNFRRLVESGALVEPTGVMSTQTGGRPAALFRFRREVLQERPAPGLRVRGRR